MANCCVNPIVYYWMNKRYIAPVISELKLELKCQEIVLKILFKNILKEKHLIITLCSLGINILYQINTDLSVYFHFLVIDDK